MDELLDQIEASYKLGHFYVALFCCLVLPDICGAISSADGTARGQRYKDWFDKYVAPKYDGNFDGGNCYAFRCAALHQGKSEHQNLGYKRVIFLAPTDGAQAFMHNNVLNDALNVDLVEFCKDVVSAVRQWMHDEASNPDFQKNMATVLKRYKGGLAPYISGADVFS